MGRHACAEVLLAHGADPKLASESLELPECVAPSAELKALLGEWPAEEVERLQAERESRLEGQWVPPERDADDEPCGEPGYSLNITLLKLADALDAVARDAERCTLIVDLGGKAATFLSYRDVNMAMAYRPDDTDPEVLRKLLLGALRFGKPFVLDMLSLPLTEEALADLLEPVLPDLPRLLLSREITSEDNYKRLLRPSDGDEYTNLTLWKERNLDFFSFILLTRLPVPPPWCVDSLFVLKVAAGCDDEGMAQQYA